MPTFGGGYAREAGSAASSFSSSPSSAAAVPESRVRVRQDAAATTEQALAEDEAIEDAWAGPIRNGLAGLSDEEAAALAAAAEALQALNARLRSDQTA